MKRIAFILLTGWLAAGQFLPVFGQRPVVSQDLPQDGSMQLDGMVQDGLTKAPIAGALVMAKNQKGLVRTQQATGSTGTFRLRLDDPKQPYVIMVHANGYAPAEESIAATSDRTNSISNKIYRLYREDAKGVIIEGSIVDATTNMGVPLVNVQVRSDRGEMLAQGITDQQAKFMIRVAPQSSYRLAAFVPGYKTYEEPLSRSSASATQFPSQLIRLQPTATQVVANQSAQPATTNARVAPPKTLDAKVTYVPPPLVIVPGKTTQLQAIQFVQSKAELLPDAQPSLDQLLGYLREHSSAEIELAGHTDNQGDFDQNLRLSKERVDIVKAYLVQNGIAAGRIQTRGYGPTRPIASNNSETTRKLNRRVEMTVLKQ